ncbi:MAG: hypothetical protein HZC22_13695 [Rhodocyclales bacterium]|nr:hypothetical protein [Rhodocyclales bacterium]
MFEETKKAVEREGRLLHIVALDDTARANYAAMGLQIRKPETVTMRKRNIKLLDRQELDRFLSARV